jgi:hypothetical protein
MDSEEKSLSNMPDEERNLLHLGQTNRFESEDDKFFPVVTDKEISFCDSRTESQNEDENSSIEIGGIKFKRNKPNLVFGLDEILQLTEAGFTVLSSEFNEHLCVRGEKSSPNGNERQSIPATNQPLDEGIALFNKCVKTEGAEPSQNTNVVDRNENFPLTDKGVIIDSNKTSQTFKVKDRENKSLSETIDIRRSNQVCKQLLGEGIALPSCGVKQVVAESSQNTNKVDQDETVLSTRKGYISSDQLNKTSLRKEKGK